MARMGLWRATSSPESATSSTCFRRRSPTGSLRTISPSSSSTRWRRWTCRPSTATTAETTRVAPSITQGDGGALALRVLPRGALVSPGRARLPRRSRVPGDLRRALLGPHDDRSLPEPPRAGSESPILLVAPAVPPGRDSRCRPRRRRRHEDDRQRVDAVQAHQGGHRRLG